MRSVTPHSTALPSGLVTLRYEEGAQVEIISPGGTRILIDVANPSALSRPATEQDVLLTTHTHADHYNRAFVKAFTRPATPHPPGHTHAWRCYHSGDCFGA
jgi:L-ascorbate metabolism protein UlaG (beta-lactamase superfamily)